MTADSQVWRDGWAEWKLARDAADELPMPLAAVPVPAAPDRGPVISASPQPSPLPLPSLSEAIETPVPPLSLDSIVLDTLPNEPIVNRFEPQLRRLRLRGSARAARRTRSSRWRS